MKIRKLSVFLVAAAIAFSITGTKTFAEEIENTTEIVSETVQTAEVEGKTEEAVTEDNEEAVNAVKEAVDSDAKIDEKKKTEEPEVKKESLEVNEKKKVKEKKNYTAEEVRLLASLIYCEANGQPYAGKLAVGIVVMNRVESSKFPNSVNGVIYQSGQFTPARNGSLSRTLSRYDSDKFKSKDELECLKAAKAALNGEKTVSYQGGKNMSGYYFFNGRVSGSRLQIADHQFK